MKKTTLRQAALKLALVAFVLLSPLGLRAQETFTLYETETDGNSYIPVYGNWADAGDCTAEFIIPASELSDLDGATISKMTFYLKTQASGAWNAPYEVYLSETSATTMTGIVGHTGATLVFTGTLNGNSSTMEVQFNDEYVYNGGNLLVGFYETSTGSYKNAEFYGKNVSNAAYYGYTSYYGFTSSAASFIPRITFTYEPAQTGGDVCEKPATCEYSNLTATSATLTWTGGSGTYNVEVKGGEWADWTAILSDTTLTTTTLNLQPTTTYQARVQSVCTGTTPTSGWKTSASFTTPCGETTLPYFYGFEDASPLACWTMPDCVSGTGRYLGTANTDSYCFRFYYGYNDQFLISPELSGTGNGVYFSFYYRQYSSGTETFHVGYSTTTNSTDAFTWGDEMTATTSYQLYENVFPAGTKYVAIKLTSNDQYYLYIDDVNLTLPPTCYMPTEAHATVQDANNATISWTPNPSNADGGSYSILDAEYNPVAENLIGTSFALSDLEASHDYTYYVQTNCFNSEEDENVELVEVSFSTPADCAAPELAADAFTHVSAHQATVSWTGFSSNIAYVVSYRTAEYFYGLSEEFNGTSIPTGWTRYSGLVDNVLAGSASLTSTTSGWKMMTASTNVFNSNHIGINIYGSSCYNWLVTPEFNLPDNSDLSFDLAQTAYSSNGGSTSAASGTREDDRLLVLISTDNGNTWVILREWNNSGSAYVYNDISNTLQNVNIPLTSYSGNVKIAFYGESTTSGNGDNDMHIDNIVIGYPVSAGNWQTVTPNPTTATTTLTGLTAKTPYDVKVKGLCNGGAESEESDIQSFTTTIACPAPTTLTVAANATDATTMVDLTWTMNGAETAWQISSLNGTVENIIDIDINESAVSINNDTVSYTLTGLIPGQVYTFKVRANCEASVTGDGTSDWSNNTESIQTEATCTEPTDFNHGTPDVHSVDLTWTESGTATQWQLCVNDDMDNLILLSSTDDDVNVDGQNVSYTLSGLTGTTNYSVKVRAYCAAGDGNQSPWVSPTEFRTACEAITTFPWREDFESYAAGNFNDPCWVNELISGNGTQIFKVNTSTTGNNTTHQLQLPDMSEGTLTKLVLPEMTLPNANYQFVLDVYRNNSTYNNSYPNEGIRVYASTDGEIEGATELTFIPRQYNVSSTLIPEETAQGWYTYEIPIGISGTCYIILRGESQYCTSTSMDNLTVEEIPSCARPTDLAKSDVTNHSATLTWTAGDENQHNWQVAYSKTSFDPNTASFDINTVQTIDFTTSTTCTYRMDRLFDAASTYYLYIRANCGTATEPDYGPWSRNGISLTTLAAAPAPSDFTASNIASTKVDLVWNAGGGDYELSWDLYYLQSDDAPTAPTDETPATKTVTTLPTTENPYTLEDLTEESRYYIWVRANHTINSVTTHSTWVALTDNYFTTLAACSAQDPVVSNITHQNATVTWDGESQDGFTVKYRTAAGIDNSATPALSENFSGTSIPTDWTKYRGKLSGNTATLTSDIYGWSLGTNHEVFDNHAYVNIYGNYQRWLVTPETTLPANAGLSFDLALTCYTSSSFAPQTNGTDDKFIVLISNDNMTTWTKLREWNNDGTGNAVYNDIANTTTGENVTIDLSDYSGQPVYIAFYGESTTENADNNLHIDNVVVAPTVPAGNWQHQAATTTTAELSGLKTSTIYDVKIVANCGDNVESDVVSFTTPAITKTVAANSWYAISTPVNTGSDIMNLTNAANDLFGYNEEEGKWVASNSLNVGQGYIYRRAAGATLNFKGVVNEGPISADVTASCEDANLAGFNLVGNPYMHEISYNYAYYSLNTNGTWQAHTNGIIGVAEGFLVRVSTDGSIDFPDQLPDNDNTANSALAFTVSNEEYSDVAYAMLDNGEGLPKIGHLNSEAPMLSIPVEGSRYAVANVGSDCQSFNLVFRGVNGTYTIKQSSNQAIAYCHLIDRVAGKDIDMLRQPSYTFSSNGFDPDRFMVKLSPDAQENANGNFAYWNGNVWMVEGNGTLQVFDALGRQLLSQEISNSNFEIQNSLFPTAGVYVLRMGEKTQKIVVR